MMRRLFLALMLALVAASSAAGVNIVRGNFIYVFGALVPLTPAQVAAATTAEQCFTINGVQVGDVVIAQKPSITSGLAVGNARVSAANTVCITFDNPTAGALTPTAESWRFLIFRPEDPNSMPSAISQ